MGFEDNLQHRKLQAHRRVGLGLWTGVPQGQVLPWELR